MLRAACLLYLCSLKTELSRTIFSRSSISSLGRSAVMKALTVTETSSGSWVSDSAGLFSSKTFAHSSGSFLRTRYRASLLNKEFRCTPEKKNIYICQVGVSLLAVFPDHGAVVERVLLQEALRCVVAVDVDLGQGILISGKLPSDHHDQEVFNPLRVVAVALSTDSLHFFDLACFAGSLDVLK
ncbi:hypothetical protein F7725_013092 [Dissostichus mawsoni]|uniref:Uncharacterized protein n=1 Tax=Dissostichus mawsoni TaxID=36200 RepID=A0A7J5YPK9_DISMA|nr:hypothetical protein F7725_013092 [Dissostichus mawsoni]